MNGIEAAFCGRIAQQTELRQSKAGKPWCSISVMIGEGENVQWLRVATFGEQAEAVAKLAKGTSVYCEGRLTLQTWTNGEGIEKSGLNIAASLIQPLAQIGKRRPPGDGGQRKASASSVKADYARPSETSDRIVGREYAAPDRDPVRQDAIPF